MPGLQPGRSVINEARRYLGAIAAAPSGISFRTLATICCEGPFGSEQLAAALTSAERRGLVEREGDVWTPTEKLYEFRDRWPVKKKRTKQAPAAYPMVDGRHAAWRHAERMAERWEEGDSLKTLAATYNATRETISNILVDYLGRERYAAVVAGRNKRTRYCPDCGRRKHKEAKRCHECYSKDRRWMPAHPTRAAV